MFYTICCTEMSYVLYSLFYGNVICSIQIVLWKCHMFYTVCSTEMSYVLYSLFYGNVICSIQFVLWKGHMFYTVCSMERSYVLYMVNLRADLRCFYSCSIHIFYTDSSREMSYVLYNLFYGNVICSMQFVLRKCHMFYI